MKNFIKQSTFLVLIAFGLTFISCESNEDVLIEEQNKELSLDFADNYTSVNLPDGRANNYPYNTITLKGNNGKYLSSENGNEMTCNRTHIGAWEKFDIIRYPDANGSQYILRGSNGKYVRVGSGSKVYANKDYANDATTFYLYGSLNALHLGRGVSWYPHYLSSENGNGAVKWDRRHAQSWETWTLGYAVW